MRRLALAAGALAALALPATAGAAQITAGPAPSSYQNPMIEIDAGEPVTFLNLDLTGQHDVTATGVGPSAQALFRSETVGFGTQVPVEGAEALGPGTYDFICSIHTFMTGAITVRGGGGGGPAGSLKLTALDSRLAKVRRAGKLRFRAKLDVPATVRVAAKAANGTKVAAGRARLGKGRGTVAAKLTRKGKRLVAKSKRLALAVTARATDADGNTAKRKLELTLR